MAQNTCQTATNIENYAYKNPSHPDSYPWPAHKASLSRRRRAKLSAPVFQQCPR